MAKTDGKTKKGSNRGGYRQSRAGRCSADDGLTEQRCVVCSETVWWPKDATLPPACGTHDYEEVFEAVEDQPNE